MISKFATKLVVLIKIESNHIENEIINFCVWSMDSAMI